MIPGRSRREAAAVTGFPGVLGNRETVDILDHSFLVVGRYIYCLLSPCNEQMMTSAGSGESSSLPRLIHQVVAGKN